MTDIVERVAMIIDPLPWIETFTRVNPFNGDTTTVAITDEFDHLKDRARKKARAVIEAMREATGNMTEQGADALNPYVDDEILFSTNCEIALDCWEAMIDAALK